MTAITTHEATLATLLGERIRSVVAVADEVLDPTLAAIVAGGHVLLEGRPGIGKTLLARTIARCLDADFKRIQFTNDLMPADVVGSMVWRASAEAFDFVEGPLFANLVLADEINRTSPRTLSCMLEAMESGAVTVEGVSRPLPAPFVVLATRNGIEFHGTYPIPEAALDRFLVRVELGYPGAQRELALYLGERPEAALRRLEPVIDRDEWRALSARVRAVAVREPVARYCHRVVERTRCHPDVALGASPRAALAWLDAARGRAVLYGRERVLPDDLKRLAVAVLAHRVFRRDGGDARPLVEQIVQSEPVEL